MNLSVVFFLSVYFGVEHLNIKTVESVEQFLLGGKPVFPIRFAHFRNVLIVFYGFSRYAYFHRDTFYLHSVVFSITAIVVVVVPTK